MNIGITTYGVLNGHPKAIPTHYLDARLVHKGENDQDFGPLRGTDTAVREALQAYPSWNMLCDYAISVIDYYRSLGRKHIVLHVFCAHGHHRSVALAEELREAFPSEICITHRDIYVERKDI